MTLVCVRIDSSYNTPRLTALADTRMASRRTDGSFRIISDTTTKLFAVPVRCFRPDTLTPVVGAWVDAYYETMIGLGFAGSCVEAMTLIAHISQSLSTLATPNDDRPIPTGHGLVHLIAKITEAYFNAHSGEGNPLLRLLIFGYEGERPWIGKVSWDKDAGLRCSIDWATEDTLECIGHDSLAEQRASNWRTAILRRREELLAARNSDASADAAEKRDRALSQLDLAEKKNAEEAMLKAIDSASVSEIGGVLQRLELGMHSGRVAAGFTHDDRAYISDTSYTVTPGAQLGPIPIVEKMAHQIRKPKRSKH